MKDIFQGDKFKKELITELTTNTNDVIIDYAEIGLDIIFTDEIVQLLPVLKTIASACKVGMAIRERHFAKNLFDFLKEFREGNIDPEKLESSRVKLESNIKYRNRVVDHIILMLDRYVDSEKSKIMGRLLIGYINGVCDTKQFIEMSSCLDLIFISDCEVLMDIYIKSKTMPSDGRIGKFINFEDEISEKIFSSIGRLRANGLISGRKHLPLR